MTPQDTVNIFVRIICLLGIIFVVVALVLHIRQPKSLDVPDYVYSELEKRGVKSCAVELAWVARDKHNKVYIVKRRSHD